MKQNRAQGAGLSILLSYSLPPALFCLFFRTAPDSAPGFAVFFSIAAAYLRLVDFIASWTEKPGKDGENGFDRIGTGARAAGQALVLPSFVYALAFAGGGGFVGTLTYAVLAVLIFMALESAETALTSGKQRFVFVLAFAVLASGAGYCAQILPPILCGAASVLVLLFSVYLRRRSLSGESLS